MPNPLQLCRTQQVMQAAKLPEMLNDLKKHAIAQPPKLVPYTSSQSDSLTYLYPLHPTLVPPTLLSRRRICEAFLSFRPVDLLQTFSSCLHIAVSHHNTSTSSCSDCASLQHQNRRSRLAYHQPLSLPSHVCAAHLLPMHPLSLWSGCRSFL